MSWSLGPEAVTLEYDWRLHGVSYEHPHAHIFNAAGERTEFARPPPPILS